MPLKIREVPAMVLEAFQAGSGQEMHEAFNLTAAPVSALVEMPPPHPVYYLSLLAIANGAGLQAAVHIGWRRVAEIGGAIHATHMDVIGDRVFHLAGDHILGEREQRVFDVRRIETVLGADTPPLEYRKLSIPPLIISALWLSSADPTRDLIIPVECTFADLVLEQTYNANQLIGQLRDIATELMETTPPLPQAQ